MSLIFRVQDKGHRLDDSTGLQTATDTRGFKQTAVSHAGQLARQAQEATRPAEDEIKQHYHGANQATAPLPELQRPYRSSQHQPRHSSARPRRS